MTLFAEGENLFERFRFTLLSIRQGQPINERREG